MIRGSRAISGGFPFPFEVLALSEMQQRTSSVANVIKAWNANASKASQLVGVKSQAVRNLLEVTPQDRSLAFPRVSCPRRASCCVVVCLVLVVHGVV